jgi:ABC-type transport system involved in multi-copper enzyme maturation permease subunit
MSDILTIARLTWREARRRKIFWAALALGAAFIALYTVAFYFTVRDMRQRVLPGQDLMLAEGFAFVMVAAYYVISFLGVMLAVLTSVGTLSGEVTSHTIQSLAVKPFQRYVLVLGKWLGLTGMLTVYIVFLSAGVAAGTWLVAGLVPNALIKGVALICLQAVIMLTISLWGGTRLTTVANGVVAFMLYGVAFIGGWMEQIGRAVSNQTVVNIGIISSLLVPSEAMWKMAAYDMQPPLINSLNVSPFSSSAPPSLAMLVYALLYTALLVWLAVRSFSRRDL